MTEAEGYLRELRRALPLGFRRRLVAEIREHFAAAVAAEAERGLDRTDAERLTIERLGPARGLAGQLRADLRSGAVGRRGRLAASLTTRRMVAYATVIALAIVAGAFTVARHSSRAEPAPQRAAAQHLTIDPVTGYVRPVLLTWQAAQDGRSSAGPVLHVWYPAKTTP